MGKGLLVVIGGPTASGKTKVAANVAEHLGTEVISGDSRQFYKTMRIGTARPTEEELLGVKHHFLGHLELSETWSAGEFARQAEPVLQLLLEKHGIAVLVGGSGLYLDALCNGLDPMPMVDHAVREKLQHRFQQHGLNDLLTELDRLDPAISTVIDRNNPQRVIRALEVCLVSGKPFSAQHTGHRQRTDIRVLRIAMDVPRVELYANIDTRVDRMIADGLEEEARSLLPHRALNALRTVGYREFFEHFDGQFSRKEAIDLIKQHTRNYAKRQITWLRREKAWKWMQPADSRQIIETIDAFRRDQI
ncbi:MAG: tRNA (adenosine(37)-N6)-dimethylallyltransferase MiaA [Flavobacteriales bacterium]|jgi:tRNA dimethylallyltransferase|nr:tRNA (adenosine(37)-N6)-dimethylallyltransferase MiaA [Flavobacteriales bacterium]MCI1754189.1 tRNA (adenosine(37)-N6)-dimethylallyltransferase MiaA [Flavobacteriales bacterium]